MQTTVKDTYVSFQSRMMYAAFLLLSVMSIVMIVIESVVMANDTLQFSELILVMNIFLGILYSMAAMLIVEVVYQDDFDQFPIFSYFARLTPELSIIQRYVFVSLVFKRQIVSVVGLLVTWIIVGDTPRAGALVMAMTLITMFTAYGMAHIKTLPQPPQQSSPTAQ